jgi:Mrp family chromosome partitioning ATPase
LLLAEENADTALDQLTQIAAGCLTAKLAERYDAIIVDAPPLGIVGDALAFAGVASQAIIVARERDTDIAALSRVARQLREHGAGSVGLVLTDVNVKSLSAADAATIKRYLPRESRRKAAPPKATPAATGSAESPAGVQ